MATIVTQNGVNRKINPFFQQVNTFVKSELSNRAALYGRRVRSVGKSAPKSVEWGYQKTAWATVQSVSNPSILLGTAGSNVMSDRKGNLTLYNADRNVPNKPLLTKVELSNEGRLGSFLKAKIYFTIFPELTSTGFNIDGIEDAFFVPGREITVKWGWSVFANNQRACTGNYLGIVYDFNWNFNPDMSISATVSIISPSGLALGISSDLVNSAEKTITSYDASGKVLVGSNLSKVIDADLSQLSSSIALSDGQSQYIPREKTVNRKIDYIAIGLPVQEGEQSSDGTSPGNRVSKTQWYVKLGAIAQFVNELLDSFNDPVKQIFAVQCYGNETQYLSDIRSAVPLDVYFPDKVMGKYGRLQPFGQGGPETNPLTSNQTDGTINIGEILLGTDFVKSTYESNIAENAANIPYKSLPKLIEELVKRVNYASGDTYDLTPVLFDPSANNITTPDGKAILSIEDTNLHLGLVVEPYEFSPTIFKPIIRSVNISSQPPPAMAMAAFTAARGNAKVQQTNVRLATNEQRDNTQYDSEYIDAKRNIDRLLFTGMTNGFSDSWSEEIRGFLVKIKRSSNATDAHWLHKAIYPVNFSVTIDGINGFKFGDTLSTTMIPSVYNTLYRMVFTVTKILHVIENKDWSTTLETAARVTTLGTGVQMSGGEYSGTVVEGITPAYVLDRNKPVLPSSPGSTQPPSVSSGQGGYVAGQGWVSPAQRTTGAGAAGTNLNSAGTGDGSILRR